jgi:hypothetical protein
MSSDPLSVASDPVVFRPRRLRVVVVVASIGLLLVTALGWWSLPADIRALFSLSQRLTLLGLLVTLMGTIGVVAASSVRADSEGLRVRNGLRTHQIPWSRVHKVLLRPGDPWGLLLVKPPGEVFRADLDAEKRMLMGIQAHDGAFARSAVDELRRRQSLNAASLE